MAHGTAAPVVREEGLGRCAAEAVLGGVVPLRVLGRLVQRMEEADHLRREGAGVGNVVQIRAPTLEEIR